MAALLCLLVYGNGMLNRTGKRKTKPTKMRLWQITSCINDR